MTKGKDGQAGAKPARKPRAKAKKTAAKPRGAKVAAPVDEPEVAKAKKAAPRKAAARKQATAATPAVTTTMIGTTRFNHAASDDAAVAAMDALAGTIEMVNAGGRVTVSAAAHGAEGMHLHLVPAGHDQPIETSPGVILTIGANGLAAFDHVGIGLATPQLVADAACAILTAIRPDEGGEAGPTSRRTDWYERAQNAARTVGEAYAA